MRGCVVMTLQSTIGTELPAARQRKKKRNHNFTLRPSNYRELHLGRAPFEVYRQFIIIIDPLATSTSNVHWVCLPAWEGKGSRAL